MIFDLLLQCTGFEWDIYNSEKIRTKHDVTPVECEQVFFNLPLIAGSDQKRSQSEDRLYVLGQTDSARLLFLVFTVRGEKLRVISSRDMNKKERGCMKPMKKIPKFKNEEEGRDFWQTYDSTEYIDWKKAQRLTLADLKPSLKTISLRLPESMLNELKLLANKRDVPYQSLVKVFLSERIEQELAGKADHKNAVQRSTKKAGFR